ncbi:8-oxo-dGTP pyrophosphatase MutT (NUDIX family) [Nonomuraea thailandensis]|uniref:8-oxo-dGTP pyrophosphatase MutT (NUDIX family) n=1 Tax=Nonomuraea thailandensis TaxID=1188745 RepID=A0A9X2K6H3_9ACTN|nr:NUDIX hydrolase [Nonomuraea thailandensis]MCP2362572.1 8-oxo-dGTP pyrophosphatase MutT (NUDIX family) [Nonomuraea thailandensis]
MTLVLATRTVPWIPVAHRLDVILSETLPPVEQTTSAFAFVSDSAGRTLMTCVDREGRGWDIPGGHLEPGESLAEAAARELHEETGLSLPASALSIFAWQRIELLEPPPADYRYPALAYMAMFRAALPESGAPTRPPAGSESTRADWLSRAEIERVCPDRTWLVLLEA